MPIRNPKIFMIIDGHALLHRAWHALPPLTTKSGRLVHGAYGFTTILLGAIRELAPTYAAVTFDLRAPTFRHKAYAAYKATREKKPDELYQQVDVVREVLDAMRMPIFTAEGFEADDVIGTLTTQAKAQDKDVEVVIVTGDLDTLQLIDRRTKVYTLRRGMTDTVVFDEAAVKERYGLVAGQMIDYKALRGDPSDNIPGVKGIGEKTATELLTEFGSLERIYEALDKDGAKIEHLKPSVKKALIDHRKDAFLARELVTIRTDAPIVFSLAACAFSPPSRERMTPVFESLQFVKLLAKLPSATPSLFAALSAPVSSDSASDASKPSAIALTAAGLKKLAKANHVAFRTICASDSPVDPNIRMIGISDGKTTVVISAAEIDAYAAAIDSVLASTKKGYVCHDIKREINVLHALGREVPKRCFDLMIGSYLLYAGERRHSLEAILGYYRSIPPAEEGMDERSRLATELEHMVSIADEIVGELKKNGLEAVNDDIDLPTAAVLAAIERAGIGVDVPYLGSLSNEFGKELERLVEQIYGVAGGEFNINSPVQLKTVLFEKLRISTIGIKKTAKGGGLSTAASELDKLRGAHPIIEHILAYREFSKLKSTYVDALPSLVDPHTGRIHASFNQTVTATGRLSSSNPNLQNIPTSETENGKKVRNAFVPRKGNLLLSADYSQFELRIAAHIAKEKAMIKAFNDGEDIHFRTAVEMFGEAEAKNTRRIAKVINFGILYGMGPQSLSETAGISFSDAQEYIDRYFSIYRGIADYVDGTVAKLKKHGYVETLFGRKRFFRNYAVMNKREQAEAERQAVNMPIQGTQADMIKLAMVSVQRELAEKFPGKAAIVAQVHDELVFDVAKSVVDGVRKLVIPLMEETVRLSVPVIVNLSIGKRWGDMEKIELEG